MQYLYDSVSYALKVWVSFKIIVLGPFEVLLPPKSQRRELCQKSFTLFSDFMFMFRQLWTKMVPELHAKNLKISIIYRRKKCWTNRQICKQTGFFIWPSFPLLFLVLSRFWWRSYHTLINVFFHCHLAKLPPTSNFQHLTCQEISYLLFTYWNHGNFPFCNHYVATLVAFYF